jgi:hypothetical protein
MYFKTNSFVKPYDLNKELKRNPHYSALCAQAAQQVCGAVGESVKSYKGLIKLLKKGEREHRPKFPNYRTKGELQVIAYPKQALGKKLVNGEFVIPLGQNVQAWFGLNLDGVSRGALTRPTRIKLWVTAKKGGELWL